MWSGWNHCSMAKTCGIGYQQRFRVCDNPKPMYGGARCPGVPVEARMCYPNVCLGKEANYDILSIQTKFESSIYTCKRNIFRI